ncbi:MULTISPECIES: hypothetical protein [Pseudoalteromonas]|uniref:Uncharacterized protein family (UPF0149) n=1 Tax=Pseudoalteromonas luteoviolacea (strain 2ta16) TaxID=1353533 RepID=V4HAQ0_PSEL2|nr:MULTISPECIES: hypothetical protein [Pseudoalteromonas]ESP94551.1 uncharacterized protein family (UPF0149) [Pseudoalteromonas luteoviolacea 2ta16]KZN32245.1 hypothetical protein N483_03605 [Pseudoalteromonas luteoviolacea NCIMB 1944]MCG7548044.1 hypothetical protein [Pseudoalteromonas sp. Of7M-16]
MYHININIKVKWLEGLQSINKIKDELSFLSEKQPDPFFIEGYIVGLGLTPQTVLPSVWIPKLFGDDTPDDEMHLRSLMDFYHVCMDSVMEGNLTLPIECSLSKLDLQTALRNDMPLPNYCMGMLLSLSFIEQNSLSPVQSFQLKKLRRVLSGLKSYLNAQNTFGESRDFRDQALSAHNELGQCIRETAYEMRFSDQCIQEAEETSALPGFNRDQIESHLNDILNKDSQATLKLINELITVIERELITVNFIEQFREEIENLHEAQPYFILKTRKAQIHFNLDEFDVAQRVLEELIELAPNDYYKNRYQLYNCYIKQQKWSSVSVLVDKFDSCSLPDSATQLLCEYAQNGNSQRAQDLKSHIKQRFPEFVALAGADSQRGNNQISDAMTEYIGKGGLKAWRSVEGSLFWLKA